ncbi:ABC transporter permease subunit [Saccharopolyspora hirsuta]|uniref:ABC transporter permease subunit n=1 Tax=Saccharopolyspora hirsuta TaxID=1837 RepID=UPI00189305E2|nr:ABC transporter permease subunit [Nocardia farcinica]
MIWLTWRQHRLAVAAIAAVLVGFAGWFLLLGSGMRGSLAPGELSGCLGIGVDCGEWATSVGLLSELQQTLLPLIPALIGAFLGAPMLSREIEHRTLRYAWTQGVSREHWLFGKVLLLGGVIVLLGSAFSAGYMYFFQPAVPEWSWFDSFGMAWPSFPALCLFGFALGVLAGTLTRHVLVGMALALFGFLAVFLPVVAWLRPRYMSPERIPVDEYYRGEPGWITDFTYRTPTGAEVDVWEAMRMSGVPHESRSFGSAQIDQLQQAGFTELAIVQPGDRFWTFQLVDATVFAVLAAVCIGATCWLLRRKAL